MENKLQCHVERRHKCRAKLLHCVQVEAMSQWDGPVHVFALYDHPTTDICYAWVSPLDKRVYAVLHADGDMDDAEKAVKSVNRRV